METIEKTYSTYKLTDIILGLVSLVLLLVSILLNKINPFGVVNTIKNSANLVPIIISLFFIILFILYGILLLVYFVFYIKNTTLNIFLNEFISDSWIIPLFTSLLLFVGIFFSIFTVSGTSMEPTYYNDDRLVTVLKNDYKKDDIIYFEAYDSLRDTSKYLIKRIVATEGDTITVKYNGEVIVNGENLETLQGYSYKTYDNYTLGKDEYYCLGDNRAVSKDSRYYGIINENNIHGKVIIKL